MQLSGSKGKILHTKKNEYRTIAIRVALQFSSDLGMPLDFSEKVKMRTAKSPNPKSKKLIDLERCLL